MTKEFIYTLLEKVKDPEIPVISVLDLGIIKYVDLVDDKWIIGLTPTFAGCPAIERMQSDILSILAENGIANAEVKVLFTQPWSSNEISFKGRCALKQFGLSPPPKVEATITAESMEHAQCPRCDSTNTVLKNAFGPTACRAIHHCLDCRETFEQFKGI